MLKVEGLRGKLVAKFHGRFKIKGRTEHGNYKLFNSLDEELEDSYPITKIRPIIEDEEKPSESFEISIN